MNRPIALLTDFGTHDHYVGVMKGVMLGVLPDARFIDISHHIPPQHVRIAAFSLMNAFAYFPAGTVFLVVVDPGVGSTRRPIAVQAEDYLFVAPDNGVLSYALSQIDSPVTAVELNKANYHLENVSTTFHGRDIFAPVAAHLASGVSLADIGRPLERITQLPQPDLQVQGEKIIGEVIHIDRFGNVITSIGTMKWIDEDHLTLAPLFSESMRSVRINPHGCGVKINNHRIRGIRRAYSDALRGDVLALVESAGFLEIAVNQGSAAISVDVSVGDRVELSLGDLDAAIRD